MYAMVDAIGGETVDGERGATAFVENRTAFAKILQARFACDAPTLDISISYERVRNEWKRMGREGGNVSSALPFCRIHVTILRGGRERRRSEGLEIGRKEKKGGKRGRGRKRLEKVSR